MKIKRIHLEFFAAAILSIIIAWFVLSGFSASTGKPTEKTFTWLTCQSFLVMAKHAAQENQSVFEFSKLNPDEKSDLLKLSQDWHKGADFFVKTNFAVRQSAKEIVIVSSWELPTAKPTLWNFFREDLAFVAGYSDGTIGLLSPTEFTNLNLNSFFSTASLATNSELKTFK